MKRALTTILAAAVFTSPLSAQQASMEAFSTGPVFEEFGPHASVDGAEPLASLERFAIAFDVAAKADDGARNRGFESAARFINMHVAAGIPEDRIEIAIVAHGRAVFDLVTDEALTDREMEPNGSAAMVRAMLDHGVRFIVCGQSAAAYGVGKDDLIEGVELQLSAMTAHALLQQDGYTVNPF